MHNLQTIYLTQRGRMTRKEFLLLGMGLSIVLAFFSLIGMFTSLALFVVAELALGYVNFVIFSKRVQDMARPGQIPLIYIQSSIAFIVLMACADGFAEFFYSVRPCLAGVMQTGFGSMESLNVLSSPICAAAMGTAPTLSPLGPFHMIIMIVLIVLIGVCCFVPGYRGTNDFGPDPTLK